MIDALQINEVPGIPSTLRERHLASLQEGQELYVERLVQRGRNFLLTDETGLVGYAVLHQQTVVEYHFENGTKEAIQAGLDTVLDQCQALSVLCQTFDPQLLSAISGRGVDGKVVGRLYRRLSEPDPKLHPVFTPGKATVKDIPGILAMHDGFFDGPAEIHEYLRQDGLWTYLTNSGELAGCGVMRRVVSGWNHVDIGMVVNPSWRRVGVGTHIVLHLRQHCLRCGWQPVCGCGADNLASQRTLEKAGFASEHALLEFTVGTL